MQALIGGMAANSKAKFSSVSDIITSLQDVLARSQVTMPDLESAYSQARFLNVNYSAIELEDQSIGALITERRQQLDAALLELSDLETIVENINNLHQQLVERKDKIAQSLNLHKRHGSALWRLPTEVLSEIFHHCLTNSDDSELPSDLEVLMWLTGVCQRWRVVAVGTPSLWCRLSVAPDRRYDWNNEVLYYDLWLKRSRGHPLSLKLYCCKNWHSSELRSFLQPYIHQISSLFINFAFGANQPELMLTDIPALQELTIVAMGIDGSAIVQCISRLPITLRRLEIIGPSFDLGHVSLCSRVWARLTNVIIAIREPNAVLRLLQLGPDLSSLAIRTSLRSIQALVPFMHVGLQSLRINAGFMEPWPHVEFKAFLMRSNCALETLILGSGTGTTDEQRAEYVALVPSLNVVSDLITCVHF
ncbi:hypothetical protein DFJ58DRAFT_773814 [Suillus subalutaceus]|uniref:uncharacterized protein n=1 Tax=Suillus subalutaceus TaxID=48586 RepID=UPI001B86F7A6|nr:uncharacterized protein DFJ58DRAFT_773814 [Suillus subalutaceus]KAG1863569.1 hypothetical protein DFJ58DRAFT_773814 [Suillus subalutaceus]